LGDFGNNHNSRNFTSQLFAFIEMSRVLTEFIQDLN